MKTYKFEIECKKNVSFESTQIIKSEDAFKYARQLWGSDIYMYESCFIMLLDHLIISDEKYFSFNDECMFL